MIESDQQESLELGIEKVKSVVTGCCYLIFRLPWKVLIFFITSQEIFKIIAVVSQEYIALTL